MKNKKYALSIVEAMVIILITAVGLVGVYSIYTRSIKATNNIGNKIQAIQIAREGIEAMMNIRDTNWLQFPSDKKNCWKTFNYDSMCIGDDGDPKKSSYIVDGSYKVYRDENGKWILSGSTITTNYEDPKYREFFKVSLDDKWLYTQNDTQSGIIDMPQNFTRELIISPISATESETPPFNNAIKVISKVMWVDGSSTSPQDVVLEMVLTNHGK